MLSMVKWSFVSVVFGGCGFAVLCGCGVLVSCGFVFVVLVLSHLCSARTVVEVVVQRSVFRVE